MKHIVKIEIDNKRYGIPEEVFNYIRQCCDKINELEEDLDAEKSISSNLAQRILRAVEYLEHEQFEKNVLSFNTIINKTKQILKGEEND